MVPAGGRFPRNALELPAPLDLADAEVKCEEQTDDGGELAETSSHGPVGERLGLRIPVVQGPELRHDEAETDGDDEPPLPVPVSPTAHATVE